jgi:uncharacterized protein (TIGR03437 family)
MRLPPIVILATLLASQCTFGQTYTITTVVGNGTGGFAGDNGPAPMAELRFPQGIAVDRFGNLWIADSNNSRIREVSNGVITTAAGTGAYGFGGDNGLAISAVLNDPYGVAVDSAGNVYISDLANNRVRKLSNGTITTFAGGGSSLGDNGPAASAMLSSPHGLAVDSGGNVYVADTGNNRIRKVSNGVITTVAGNGMCCVLAGDNGPAISAVLNGPTGVAVDPAGNLYIADEGNGVVRKVSSGIITTFAGMTTGSGQPPNCPGVVPAGGPAPPTCIYFNDPVGVAVDGSGDVFIADLSNQIFKVSNGEVTVVAGNGVCCGFGGDNGPATSALVNGPYGVAVNNSGGVYIADAGNNRIRALTPAGPTCAYSVGPVSTQAPATGGDLTFSIQTTAACSWAVSGLPNWIAISGAASGTGSATVMLVVSPNNSGTSLSATILIAGVSVVVTQPSVSPPTITAVVNGASFQSGPISPGEIVTLGGNGLGPSAPVGLTLDQNGTVSTMPGGVQVLFSGIPAPLTYVSSTQINAVVPYEIEGLLAPFVQVNYQGQVSKAFSLTPASTVPAIFTLNGSGTGPAAALNQDYSYNTSNNPAAKGSYVILYVTGEGQTAPLGVTGKVTTVSSTPPLTPQPLLPVVALINGQPASIAFYGCTAGDMGDILARRHG